MVNQSKCQCTITRFTVSDVMVASANGGQLFFNVYAECVDCKGYQIVALHIMPDGGSKELFYEHHEMVKDFYEELS